MADQTPNMSQLASRPTTPAPTPGSGPTISSASTSSSRPYVPQFSVATQLILQRLKAKEGKNDGSGNSLSSVVSSKTTTLVTGSPSIKLEQDAFEDAKKRLVAGTGMKTSTSMSLQMPMVMPSIKMPTPSPTMTVKNLSLPRNMSTAPRAGSSLTTANLSLPLPPPPPPKHKSLTFKNNTTSAIKNINSGLTASGKVSVVKPPKPSSSFSSAAVIVSESRPKKAKISTGNPVGRPSNASKAAAAAAAALAASDAIGHRKKRIKQQQDLDELSSLSSLSDVLSEPEAAVSSGGAASALLTMTKSGRQVLKPTTYNPAAVDAANKRHRNANSNSYGNTIAAHGQYGNKRTAEQALCKKCTRMHSPASNPMVFCDGCNEGWHQRCHDPFIPTEVIRDQTLTWICSTCVAKKEKHLSKKQQKIASMEQVQQTRTSWADKPPQQKRAYLSTLPPQELVGLLMAALEVHPDLPIFPGPPAPARNNGSNGKGPKPGPNGNKSLKDIVLSREPSQDEGGGEDAEEYDPLAALWPKPGSGLYSLLPLNDADDDEYLVDTGDFEAFSSIVYDDRGRKVLENGLRV